MILRLYWAVTIAELTERQALRLVNWAREQGIADGCALDPETCWGAYFDRTSAMWDANALRGRPPLGREETGGHVAMAESLEDWLDPPGGVRQESYYWMVDLPGLAQEGAQRIKEWAGGLYDADLVNPVYWMTVCVDRWEASTWLRALRGAPPASEEERRTRQQMLTVFDAWLAQGRDYD